LTPGDVVVGVLVGAQETKVRPAVVIASPTYLAERPDAVVGILTTKLQNARHD
jgi:mRNA-degrading endonuclease toxin of MazEF toxin-antitoxin module